jgi:hypothetical protein
MAHAIAVVADAFICVGGGVLLVLLLTSAVVVVVICCYGAETHKLRCLLYSVLVLRCCSSLAGHVFSHIQTRAHTHTHTHTTLNLVACSSADITLRWL